MTMTIKDLSHKIKEVDPFNALASYELAEALMPFITSALAERALEPQGQALPELPPLPEPLEINWPCLHSNALGCGVEDRGLRDRYECAEYGWQEGVDRAAECVPEQIYDADQMHAYARAYASQLALPAGPVPEEDGYEMRKAMMEGEMAASADGYFKARTDLDSYLNRHLFRAGYERGYETGNCDRSIGTSLLSPAVAQPEKQ